MHSGADDPQMRTGFPHSEIPGSQLGYQLLWAYRRFPRPSSPLNAKTSTVCPYSLDHTDPIPATARRGASPHGRAAPSGPIAQFAPARSSRHSERYDLNLSVAVTTLHRPGGPDEPRRRDIPFMTCQRATPWSAEKIGRRRPTERHPPRQGKQSRILFSHRLSMSRPVVFF